jgi:hypothetical protein
MNIADHLAQEHSLTIAQDVMVSSGRQRASHCCQRRILNSHLRTRHFRYSSNGKWVLHPVYQVLARYTLGDGRADAIGAASRRRGIRMLRITASSLGPYGEGFRAARLERVKRARLERLVPKGFADTPAKSEL